MKKAQIREFGSALVRATPMNLSEKMAQLWIENQDVLAKTLARVLAEFPQEKTPDDAAPLIHTIDCDANPYTPEGWRVEEHRKGGQSVWNKEKVALYLSERQKGSSYIIGNDLRKELADKPVMNACVLDFLLAHPELIPESWKGKAVFFWGTIYRGSSDLLYVRCLYWRDSQWFWDYYWLASKWHSFYPAVVSAS